MWRSIPLQQSHHQAADHSGEEPKETGDLIRAQVTAQHGAREVGGGVLQAQAAADPRRCAHHLHRQLTRLGAEAGDHPDAGGGRGAEIDRAAGSAAPVGPDAKCRSGGWRG